MTTTTTWMSERKWWKLRIVTGEGDHEGHGEVTRTMKVTAPSHKQALGIAEREWTIKMRYDIGRTDYNPEGYFTFKRVKSCRRLKTHLIPDETQGFYQHRLVMTRQRKW